ncbi:MAG: hypothetical protein ACYDFT_07495, partial [Thermoplasmata archaeon]
TATETTPRGPVPVRVRNPVPTKAAFDILAAPVGPCRPPLGRLTPNAFADLGGTLAEIDSLDPGAFDLLRSHLSDGPSSPSEVALRWCYDGY